MLTHKLSTHIEQHKHTSMNYAQINLDAQTCIEGDSMTHLQQVVHEM